MKQFFRPQLFRFSTSVRNKEVEFYSKIEDWWSPNGPQKQLLKFNRVRVNFIRRHLVQQKCKGIENEEITLARLSAVDVGCGAGLLSESLGRVGIGKVVGIDPTPKCIELAQSHLNQDVTNLKSKVNYKNCTVEDLIA